MSKHVIFGAGPIGTAVAEQLDQASHEVVVVSRSGRGPSGRNITKVSMDASDAAKVAEVSAGATAIYNCLNPAYTRWEIDWPPMAKALLDAAIANDAVYAICGNLYGYGPVDGPIAADLPLAATGMKGRVRALMWEDALAAHNRGDVRVTEVRSSDYIGANSQSHLGERVVTPLLKGKNVRVVGDPDATHSWTFTHDAARTLVSAASNPTAWDAPGTRRRIPRAPNAK